MSEESANPTIYTVSSLTEQVKELLEDHFEFVWLEGEISNFRVPSSGHYYMVLKDKKAQIRGVMFRTQSRYLKFMPEDGMMVIAQGRISVYQPRGEYQIILDYLEPMGVGALAVAFEQLKKKLAARGVFDEAVKKPLPFLPQRVAVITSPTGAAIRDFLNVIRRRFVNVEITIVPVKVQGEDAAGEMVEALEMVNSELDVDVIVLTRGGGSVEDLWAFNREELAYAIRASQVPVVSAVGHEIDTTISDLAADFRAPTPSAAAELLVVEKESLRERLVVSRDRLDSAVRASLSRVSQRLTLLSRGLRDPRRRMADSWMRLDELNGRLIRLVEFMVRESKRRVSSEVRTLVLHSPLTRVASSRHRLHFQTRSLTHAAVKRLDDSRKGLCILEEKIKDLSPFSVLSRGYSIARKLPEKTIIKEVTGLKRGDQVHVLLAEGGLDCMDEKIHQE